MSKTADAHAYELIRSMILDGRFSPGEWLKEGRLTALCGVSRTPVREALRRLSAEGLVNREPRLGAQVAAATAEEMEEVYRLRALLERHAASRAATRITPAQVDELKRLLGEMEAIVYDGDDASWEAFSAYIAAFNGIVIGTVLSPRLAAMIQSILEYSRHLKSLESFSRNDRKRTLRQHRELISAFDARDEAWAAAVTQSVVRHAYHVLTQDRGRENKVRA